MSDTNNQIRKQIDAYLNGQLSEKEIEALWVEFAKNPDLLDELEIEVGVENYLKKGRIV